MTPIFMRIWLMKKSVVCCGDAAGELAQGLAHETGLQTDVAVAHFAFDFGLGHKSCDGVDNNQINSAGAHERVGDLEACSPKSGWLTRSSSVLTPSFFAYGRRGRAPRR
jgi:hypothetical protein